MTGTSGRSVPSLIRRLVRDDLSAIGRWRDINSRRFPDQACTPWNRFVRRSSRIHGRCARAVNDRNDRNGASSSADNCSQSQTDVLRCLLAWLTAEAAHELSETSSTCGGNPFPFTVENRARRLGTVGRKRRCSRMFISDIARIPGREPRKVKQVCM